MKISASTVKELREKTNAGIMDCKRALTECNGDIVKALDWLRQKGLAVATRRAGYIPVEGRIMAYIHPGNKLGVLVEINSETDFTGRTEDFAQFTKDIAMQIAATNPICINEEDLPIEILTREREIYMNQAKDSGKPEKMWDKIIEGKLKKFIFETVLIKQIFVKDQTKTIEDLLNEMRAKVGENIQIRRFARFQLGEKFFN